MTRKALAEQNYELIMAHILDPENSPLPADQQGLLERVISMSKLLDRYPVVKQAIALHCSKYPDISHATAYTDIKLARKVYNSVHEFDYDYYRMWLINDIMKSIERCRQKESYHNNRVIAQEHANLLKAIGEKQQDIPDPKRNEKHEFYIMVNYNSKEYKIDLNKLHDKPEVALKVLNQALLSGNEISEIEAAEIMNS